jgi:hypothetical protein
VCDQTSFSKLPRGAMHAPARRVGAPDAGIGAFVAGFSQQSRLD